VNRKPKPLGNLLMGIRFSSLMNLILKNGIGLRPVFLLRLLVLLPTSLLSEFFALVEMIRYGKKINSIVIEKPPVFIIGHWRSGTTLLHQLISLDRQFTAPKVIQSVIPDHFLFSSRYWIPVLEKLMPPKRPMDEVEMGPLDPMEDEWALLRLGAPTPMRKLFFPSRQKPFYEGTGEFNPSGHELDKWKGSLLHFLKKVTMATGMQIVLKNPYHTPRVKLLAELFPGARFVHIVRHPYKIVPSAINMWNIVAGENAMRGGWKSPSYAEASGMVNDFRISVNESRKNLPAGSFAEVRYEDLERNPAGELKRLYEELNLSFTDAFGQEVLRFMEEKKNYKKNRFDLSHEEKTIIAAKLSDYMDQYSYDRL
jgi:hypothetical protein